MPDNETLEQAISRSLILEETGCSWRLYLDCVHIATFGDLHLANLYRDKLFNAVLRVAKSAQKQAEVTPKEQG